MSSKRRFESRFRVESRRDLPRIRARIESKIETRIESMLKQGDVSESKEGKGGNPKESDSSWFEERELEVDGFVEVTATGEGKVQIEVDSTSNRGVFGGDSEEERRSSNWLN